MAAARNVSDPAAMLTIRSFVPADRDALIALWRVCGLVRPTNDPARDIARKQRVRPDLLLVGTVGTEVVASAMVGYEGHRGWINYLAVAPAHRQRGFGRALLAEAEVLLGTLRLLAREGGDLDRVVAITFTRKAADEMKARVQLALEKATTSLKWGYRDI